MHVILKNQVTKEVEGLLCIDRESQTCIILHADIDRLDDLVSIARGMKVPNIRLMTPRAAVEQLAAYGWKLDEDMVVVTK